VRGYRCEFERLAISAIVHVVLAVPAFAQSDDRLRLTGSAVAPVILAADRTSLGVMRIFSTADTLPAPVPLPSNLTIPDDLRPLIDSMLRRSPTFRRQCLRIAEASNLTIVLQYAHSPTSHVRARTRMTTLRGGRRLAMVEIRQLDDSVELIAHEIEHVVEQLDGVDLSARAALPATGVHRCEDGDFETIRAIRIGAAVADEVRGRAP
jgi:hypothetical protein